MPSAQLVKEIISESLNYFSLENLSKAMSPLRRIS